MLHNIHHSEFKSDWLSTGDTSTRQANAITADKNEPGYTTGSAIQQAIVTHFCTSVYTTIIYICRGITAKKHSNKV